MKGPENLKTRDGSAIRSHSKLWERFSLDFDSRRHLNCFLARRGLFRLALLRQSGLP